MVLFLLKPKCGNHIGPPDKEGNRTTYKSGDRVSSDDDLVARYPSKFELAPGQSQEGRVATAPDIPTPSKSTIKSKSKKSEISNIPEPEKSEYGIDVTEEFPTASKVELKVFEKSRWFTVVDPDNNEVLNDKKLRRDKVEGFLVGYLPEEEEPDDDDIDEE